MNRWLFSLCLGTSLWAAPAEKWEPAMLFALAPAPEQSKPLSVTMAAVITAFQAEGGLAELAQWTRITELPAWVRDPKKREVFLIPPRPMVIHDYRYAVMVGTKGDVVVVRAGGLGDRYDYFLKPKVARPPVPR